MKAMPASAVLQDATAQRRQVQAALNVRAVATPLAAALGIAVAPGVTPRCHIVDVKYEAGEYCSVMYRLEGRLVIGVLRWDERAAEVPETARLLPELGMLVYRFEDDPALPGLATVLDGAVMATRLADAVPALAPDAARVLRCEVTPLRYRAGKRCTLRFDVAVRERATGALHTVTYYGKVYHQVAKAAATFAEMRMLADSAPARDGRMIVARSPAFLPDLGLVLQEPVEGLAVEHLLTGLEGAVRAGDPRAWDAVVRCAPPLAALHTAGLRSERERPITGEMKRFASRSANAAAVAPRLGQRLIELSAALRPGLALLPEWGEELSLVHGDCKPSQFLIGPDGVAILDFDHCGMADPATDVGTFLATLRQLGIWQALHATDAAAAVERKRWLRALEATFLDEYCRAGARDERFRLRAGWYEAVALQRKALRSFARSPRSAMVDALVDEGWRCLAVLPTPAAPAPVHPSSTTEVV